MQKPLRMLNLRPYLCALALAACGDDSSSDGDDVLPDAAPDSQVDVPADAPADAPAVDLTLTLELPGGGSSSDFAFVAIQDGEGAWQKLTSGDGVYRASTNTGRFGFMVVCSGSPDSGYRHVDYRTTADGTDVTLPSCRGEAQIVPHVIRGTLSNLANESVSVATSTIEGWVDGDTSTYVVGALPRASDLLVTATQDGESYRYLRRALGTVTGDQTVDIDLLDAQPGERPLIAIGGVTAADNVFLSIPYLFADEGSYRLPSYEGPQPVAHRLPLGLRKPGDVVALYLSATQEVAGSPTRVTRAAYDSAATTHALPDLPPVAGFTSPTLDASAGVPWTFTLPTLALEDNRRLYLYGGPYTAVIELVASSAWLAQATTLVIDNPTGLAGWNPAWNVPSSSSWHIGFEARSGTQVTSSALYSTDPSPFARADERSRVPLRRLETLLAR